MRPLLVLFLGASLLGLAGCGRCQRETARVDESPPAPAEEPHLEPVAPGPDLAAPEPSGGEQLRAAAVNVPRRPHPSASEIFTTDSSVAELDPKARAAMVAAADRCMAANVPDFAIKDSARPWLDRQYVPQAWTVTRSADGELLATLRMRVDAWDEGRPAQAGAFDLRLRWSGSEWVLVEVPHGYAADMADALRTLQQDWRPGERELPIP